MTSRPASAALLSGLLACALGAQDPGQPDRAGRGPGQPGGLGAPRHEKTAVLERFDRDRNGLLDRDERPPARAWLKENRPQRNPMRRGPAPVEATADATPRRGATLGTADVPSWPDHPFFTTEVLRTIFLEFPQEEWFEELTDFYRTDVALPATMTVDGVTYPDVGVAFRGNSSFFGARGRKKSLDLTFDLVHPDQRLCGYESVDLLNCHADPSFLREVLHGWIAGHFVPALKAAPVRVVINGEDHGIYAAVQQFDKGFLQENYATGKGARFKVPPDFGGGGGLRFLGDDPADYRRGYQIKTKDDPLDWQRLVDVCAVLAQTPDEDLQRILPQYLAIDSALWFLALDNALVDGDGYHSRGSDYSLYLDPKGRFHPIPRDNNEILGASMGGPPGGRRGPGGPPPGAPRPDGAPADRPPGGRPMGGRGPGGVSPDLAPLAQAERDDRPLAHRLLSVPAWRQRYLANLRAIARERLDWSVVGPAVAAWQSLIGAVVETDVHAIYGHDAFLKSLATDAEGPEAARTLRGMLELRRKTILEDPALAGPWPGIDAAEHELLRETREGKDSFILRLRCRTTAEAPAVGAVLYFDRGKHGTYDAVAMHDDGQHGDGAVGDGLFGLASEPIDPSTTVRYWIEVTAASGRVACHPAGAGARPVVLRTPKKND